MIGDRVKRYRIEKRMSMTELADKAGVAKSYLSSLERNLQSNPSIRFLEKIAAVLDIPLEYLIHNEPEPDQLDDDWANLVREAMDSGVTKEQFREFIEFSKWQQTKKNNLNL